MAAVEEPSVHVERFLENSKDVDRLLELHAESAGTSPGHKHEVEVLNKSAVVLLVACWEAFIEDMVSEAFDLLLRRATTHEAIPAKVRIEASNRLRKDHDERAVWELAGAGWRAVMERHRAACFKQYLGTFHTPRTEPVDNLCETLLGLKGLSKNWHWHGVSVDNAKERLEELINLRGDIAHRVSASRPVRKNDVVKNIRLVSRLVVASHEAVAQHLGRLLGGRPWTSYFVRT